MQRKWVRNIVHRYLLRGRFFWWGKDLKEDCVESSLRLCLGTLVLPYKDQLFLRSSTFLLQILFLRHDLEQLNAGLSWSCTVPSSPGHAIHVHMLVMGQPHASRHVIRHSGPQGPNHTVKRGVQQAWKPDSECWRWLPHLHACLGTEIE
jgi:hypothetical protein